MKVTGSLVFSDLGKPSEEKICFCLEFYLMALTPPPVFLEFF